MAEQKKTVRFINKNRHNVSVTTPEGYVVTVHPWSDRTRYPGGQITFIVEGTWYGQFGTLTPYDGSLEARTFRTETSSSSVEDDDPATPAPPSAGSAHDMEPERDRTGDSTDTAVAQTPRADESEGGPDLQGVIESTSQAYSLTKEDEEQVRAICERWSTAVETQDEEAMEGMREVIESMSDRVAVAVEAVVEAMSNHLSKDHNAVVRNILFGTRNDGPSRKEMARIAKDIKLRGYTKMTATELQAALIDAIGEDGLQERLRTDEDD